MKTFKYISLLLFALLMVLPTTAQEEPPRLSPKASVSQVIGYTKVTVIYSRPGVKGRAIWGGLVPYNEVWRTGANEATVIDFSDDVKVEGNEVPEGKYALFTIPGEDEWTIILNKIYEQWGSFNYDPNEDWIRFKVTPEESDFTERFQISFDYESPYSSHVILEWDRIEVPLLIETK